MRQNPHVRICGGPGSATTLVYPTGQYRDGSLELASGPEGIDQRDMRHPAVALTVVEATDLLNGLPDLFGRDDDNGAFVPWCTTRDLGQ